MLSRSRHQLSLTRRRRTSSAAKKPLVSNNVEPLVTLPVPHPIGARFRDGLMYVTTTEGLTVYDITDPALPVPVGALALPHFENEDVDLGGDILLVSNDPSEGVGRPVRDRHLEPAACRC